MGFIAYLSYTCFPWVISRSQMSRCLQQLMLKMTLLSVQHTLVKCRAYTFTISFTGGTHTAATALHRANGWGLRSSGTWRSDCSAHDNENAKVSVTTHLTQRHIPDVLYPQQYQCENLKSCFNINQLDALNFIMSLFQASTCFEHMCSPSGGQNCTIQTLVSSHL